MNTNKKLSDYIVFIGRMEPPHAAHIEIVWQALQQAKTVIILIGSANQPRTITNPWTWKEREDMIRACFDAQYQDRILLFLLHPVIQYIIQYIYLLDVQDIYQQYFQVYYYIFLITCLTYMKQS